ncbi:MAG: crotonase/enoyl-CoA hydratase family protein [Myxococcota bacterium]
MAAKPVTSEIRGAVALARLDDGKANAISESLIEALHAHLDVAESQAGAVLLTGRPGMLSGGFDLTVMRGGGGAEAVRRLVQAGAELFVRFIEFPKPIVVAATGHAVAAGALTLLSADRRIGAAGDFKIGLNEVGVGMTLPVFAVELARHRLSVRHLHRAVNEATLYAPHEAVDAGYLDRVVPADQLEAEALAEASRMAAYPQPGFGATKQRLHAQLAETIRGTLDADLKQLLGV